MEILAVDEGLTLRLINEADAEGYITLIYENSEILKAEGYNFYFLLGKMLTDYCWAYAEGIAKLNQEGDYYNYLLYQANSPQPIGNIYIYNIQHQHSTCEVAFLMDDDFTRQGWATQMLRRVVEFCVEQIKIQAVFASILPDNLIARKILEKAGFKKESQSVQVFEGAFRAIDYYVVRA